MAPTRAIAAVGNGVAVAMASMRVLAVHPAGEGAVAADRAVLDEAHVAAGAGVGHPAGAAADHQ